MTKEYPSVTVAVLAKDKASMLPAWLRHMDMWDYPQENIRLWIRTNDSKDGTDGIIEDFIEDKKRNFGDIAWDWRSVNAEVKNYGVHEWNPVRFDTLGKVRNESIQMAKQWNTDFYFVCDVDNFILPHTLSELVKLNLPAVAPFLVSADHAQPAYSNFHNIATPNGYYQENPLYYEILNQHVKGLIECDVIHCTYLLNRETYRQVNYLDGTDRYEYVIFSDTLRKAKIGRAHV